LLRDDLDLLVCCMRLCFYIMLIILTVPLPIYLYSRLMLRKWLMYNLIVLLGFMCSQFLLGNLRILLDLIEIEITFFRLLIYDIMNLMIRFLFDILIVFLRKEAFLILFLLFDNLLLVVRVFSFFFFGM